jgi:2-succinyl-5-enolpyruvyl-6-hydroxy-3-cyclohexene-1-carboxylate synthase
MTKLALKQHIADLVSILKQHKIKHVVICPGSRNAPFMQVFQRDEYFVCHSIVDERSAGYLALGMAKQTNQAVAIVTTSGTASLNLAPAVAEAYYQKIPLIVLTADRPEEWPPQFGNQRIKQEGIFERNSKCSFNLPSEVEDANELTILNSKVSEIIRSSNSGEKGPVHLNIPLLEPLYDKIPEHTNYKVEALSLTSHNVAISEDDRKVISDYFLQQKNVLLIAGMQTYSKAEKEILEALSSKFQSLTVAENIANLSSEQFISSPEVVLGSLEKDNVSSLEPDLVILFGEQVVSKKLRLFVQKLAIEKIKVLKEFPSELFATLLEEASKSNFLGNNYMLSWKSIESQATKKVEEFFLEADYCNLTACKRIIEAIPGNSIVHLGNSGTIRYSQLLPTRSDLTYHSNRGTSGIDGSLSTAVGAAMVSEDLHVVILGDLSFGYDSNALWNSNFPENLKVIVLNDHGGGIFRIIKGPDRMPFFEEYSVTSNQISIEHLAKAYKINYHIATDYKELESELKHLFENSTSPSLLEVETGESENSSIFKLLYKTIQS